VSEPQVPPRAYGCLWEIGSFTLPFLAGIVIIAASVAAVAWLFGII
jgi:hypothetical protein